MSEAVKDAVKRASADEAGALASVQAEVDFLARMNGLLVDLLVQHEIVSVEALRDLMGRDASNSAIRRLPARPNEVTLDLTRGERVQRYAGES